jgi:hypothetical protein
MAQAIFGVLTPSWGIPSPSHHGCASDWAVIDEGRSDTAIPAAKLFKSSLRELSDFMGPRSKGRIPLRLLILP